MKRNKRAETRGHEELTSLTEHILAQMGDEGADIRVRLKNFYRSQSVINHSEFQEPQGKATEP